MKHFPLRRNNKLILTAVSSGVIGIIFVTSSRAAVPTTSIEAESGTESGSAVVITDNTASGNQSIRFGSTTPSNQSSWQEAWNSRNQDTIDDWFAANTGYTALNVATDSLLNIDGAIINDEWLNANNGNGHIRQNAGRWIIENIRSNRIRIAVNNVTIRGCLVEAAGSHVYGIQHYPFSNAVTGTIVEYCTIVGGNSEGTGILFRSDVNSTTSGVARYNDIYGWGTGMQIFENATLEYNNVHDLYYYTGSHNASASIRGHNIEFYRNNLDDGNSSALSIYADEPIFNINVEENLFNTSRANYCVNFPSSKAYYDSVSDSHLVNNIFGQKYEPQCGSSRPMTGGNWTTRSGNTLMDGTAL